MSSRRNFIKLAGTVAFASGVPFNMTGATAPSTSAAKTDLFTLGIVGFSFAEYKDDIDKTIALLKDLKVTNVALKDFQLPYDSTQAHIDTVMNKFKSAGITVTGLGVIYMR